MEQGRILVITGSPGTGKTTTSSIIAKESSMEKSVCLCAAGQYDLLWDDRG